MLLVFNLRRPVKLFGIFLAHAPQEAETNHSALLPHGCYPLQPVHVYILGTLAYILHFLTVGLGHLLLVVAPG